MQVVAQNNSQPSALLNTVGTPLRLICLSELTRILPAYSYSRGSPGSHAASKHPSNLRSAIHPQTSNPRSAAAGGPPPGAHRQHRAPHPSGPPGQVPHPGAPTLILTYLQLTSPRSRSCKKIPAYSHICFTSPAHEAERKQSMAFHIKYIKYLIQVPRPLATNGLTCILAPRRHLCVSPLHIFFLDNSIWIDQNNNCSKPTRLPTNLCLVYSAISLYFCRKLLWWRDDVCSPAILSYTRYICQKA